MAKTKNNGTSLFTLFYYPDDSSTTGLRLAEFVSRSIDNLAQDMHVKDGMKYLGLKE